MRLTKFYGVIAHYSRINSFFLIVDKKYGYIKLYFILIDKSLKSFFPYKKSVLNVIFGYIIYVIY